MNVRFDKTIQASSHVSDMKQDVVLPQQSNYYGERCQFLHGFQKTGGWQFLENLADHLAIKYNKVDVQTSKLVNDETRHDENGT